MEADPVVSHLGDVILVDKRHQPHLEHFEGLDPENVAEFPDASPLRSQYEQNEVPQPRQLADRWDALRRETPTAPDLRKPILDRRDTLIPTDDVPAVATHDTYDEGAFETRGSECSRCHAVGPTGTSPHAEAPPFRDLPKRPLQLRFESFNSRIFGHAVRSCAIVVLVLV